MTPQELSELQEMSDKEIRRAQAIVAAQIPIAYKQRNTVALIKLQEWDRDYADEMYRRHFRKDSAAMLEP